MAALTYRSPHRSRERILTYGREGTGKSSGILTVAEKCPDSHFYILDIDWSPSYERLIEEQFPGVEERGNATVEELDPEDWSAILAKFTEFAGKVGENDWLVVDSATHLWSAVQSWYTEQVFGKDIADYFLDIRIQIETARNKAANSRKKDGEDTKEPTEFEGWTDWKVINRTYKTIYRVYKQVQGHAYLTCEAASVTKIDDKDIRDRFGLIGSKPAGQKQIGFLPHTVLCMKKDRVGEYAMTTVKDRARREMEDEPIETFLRDYLVKVAGWKPTPLRDAR